MKTQKIIWELEQILFTLEQLHTSFDYAKITIASPLRIRSWAERTYPSGYKIGEILKPETINFKTYEPEINGLFCERIFGPLKSWKCSCGKYNGFIFNRICEECLVEIIDARVRRYRMGYIDLAYPVTHLWYLKGTPNYLITLLNCLVPPISPLEKGIKKDKEQKEREKLCKLSDLENLIYFKKTNKEIYFLKRFSKTKEKSQEEKKDELQSFFFPNKKKKRKGSEIIKAALESIDLKSKIAQLRSFYLLNKKTINAGETEKKVLSAEDKRMILVIKQIRLLESFLASKTNPAWLVLTTLPVLPPSLRPLVELENGRLVAADVNEIYRMIIIRSHRLSNFFYEVVIPEMILEHGSKLLQECVDSLIDNGRVAKEKKFMVNDKALKSLTEILEGKQGRFRQSLLGKRVDYSGRSVIVVGPTLRLNQCGLPYEMAKELFQPFLINALLRTKIKASSHNTKLANIIIKKNKPFIWRLLISLTKKYSILLNRAPTLHRFGIQAFDSLLVLGQAIHLHPLVCTGFNADFDGDQMAVHLPLYESSQLEIRTMMRPSYNVLSPSNGEVILKPTQDMVIGCYYLTNMITDYKHSQKKWFGNEIGALTSFYQKKISLHTPILVRYSLQELSSPEHTESFGQLTLLSSGKATLIGQNSSFSLKKNNMTDKKIEFINPLINLIRNKKTIEVFKVFKVNTISKKCYLLTNIGILIVYESSLNPNRYQISDLFLETSAGRLIFKKNFENSLQI